MKGLERLNSLPRSVAEQEFLKCCGSTSWVERMIAQRPFVNLDELLSKADDNWRSLAPADWLEAFLSHPKIGEQNAGRAQSETARAWSAQEQSSTRHATVETMQALARGNSDYEQKFGHIFIVCASGKSAGEMLEILRERLTNDPEQEIHLAAEEQRKITQLRLKRIVLDFGS